MLLLVIIIIILDFIFPQTSHFLLLNIFFLTPTNNSFLTPKHKCSLTHHVLYI
jgi:hypothetical protein